MQLCNCSSSIPTAHLWFRRGCSIIDRKSTRLNSSHDQISYAVFCLKKKNVNAANPAQPDLALADLAVARARGAHDLAGSLDGLPELGDLAHRLARRLPDVEDFRLRNHRCQYTAPLGLKHFASGLPNPGRTEGFRAIDPSASARILDRGLGRAEKELAAPRCIAFGFGPDLPSEEPVGDRETSHRAHDREDELEAPW